MTAAAKARGTQYAERYQSAEPYHHICIDDFLQVPVIDHVIADLADLPQAGQSFSGLTPYEYICKIWTSEPD